MGRKRSLIQLGLALALAMLAGWLVMRWMDSQRQPRAVVEKPQTVDVAVATRILSPGTKLVADMIKVVPYLPGSKPDQSFEAPDELIGRVLLSPLSQNEPITKTRLASDEISAGGVSALVTPGSRAMAVAGDKVMGISGFIRPGNRVDVLVTLEKNSTDTESETKIVLENILVLATGTQLKAAEDGTEPMSVDVYTLQVTPEESERLALAANKGALHFALRNATDEATVLTLGHDITRTLSAYRADAPPEKKKGLVVAEKPRPTAEIIVGTARSTVSF